LEGAEFAFGFELSLAIGKETGVKLVSACFGRESGQQIPRWVRKWKCSRIVYGIGVNLQLDGSGKATHDFELEI